MSLPHIIDGETEASSEVINTWIDRINGLQSGTAPIALAGIEAALGEYGPLANMRRGRANIMDYNDHAGDGSVSINSLVNEMVADTSTDDVLEFPAGAYLFSGQWTLSTPRRIVFHPGATAVLANGANAHMLRIQAPGVHVFGGVFEANGANQSGDVSGIYIGHKDAVDCVLDRVRVNDAKYIGIRSQAARTKVRFCEIVESGYSGIFLQTDSFASVADQADSAVVFCTVDRSGQPTGAPIGGGIQVYGDVGDNLRTVGSTIVGNTVRMPVNPTTDNCLPIETHSLAPGTLISGNHTYGGSIAISCNQSDGSTVQGNVIVDAKYYGVECADTNRMSIVGNTMSGYSGALHGISASSLSGTEKQLSVMGNIITGFSHGIHIQQHENTALGGNIIEIGESSVGIAMQRSEKSTIFGNDILGVGSGTGVRFDTSSHLQAYGNTIDSVANAISLLATTSYVFEDSVVGRNTIRNCTSRIVESLSGGATKALSFVMLDDIQTITGSRGGNTALASLLAALAAQGYLVDGTS